MVDEEITPAEQDLRRRFADLARHGRKFDRALSTVLAGGVKETRFEPSGRRFLNVVGRLGDEFIDPDRPFCSCHHFFFRVLAGKEETCYHLLCYEMAAKSGRVDVVAFSDEEYPQVVRAMVLDGFAVLSSG